LFPCYGPAKGLGISHMYYTEDTVRYPAYVRAEFLSRCSRTQYRPRSPRRPRTAQCRACRCGGLCLRLQVRLGCEIAGCDTEIIGTTIPSALVDWGSCQDRSSVFGITAKRSAEDRRRSSSSVGADHDNHTVEARDENFDRACWRLSEDAG